MALYFVWWIYVLLLFIYFHVFHQIFKRVCFQRESKDRKWDEDFKNGQFIFSLILGHLSQNSTTIQYLVLLDIIDYFCARFFFLSCLLFSPNIVKAIKGCAGHSLTHSPKQSFILMLCAPLTKTLPHQIIRSGQKKKSGTLLYKSPMNDYSGSF